MEKAKGRVSYNERPSCMFEKIVYSVQRHPTVGKWGYNLAFLLSPSHEPLGQCSPRGDNLLILTENGLEAALTLFTSFVRVKVPLVSGRDH